MEEAESVMGPVLALPGARGWGYERRRVGGLLISVSGPGWPRSYAAKHRAAAVVIEGARLVLTALFGAALLADYRRAGVWLPEAAAILSEESAHRRRGVAVDSRERVTKLVADFVDEAAALDAQNRAMEG